MGGSKYWRRLVISRYKTKVCVRSSSRCGRNRVLHGVKSDQEVEFLMSKAAVEAEEVARKEAVGGGGGGNRVMVVVDSSVEAKGALEWALSHTIQPQDTVVLLHVAKPRKKGFGRKRGIRLGELLQSMKNTCQKKRPGVRVEVAMVEGKEKGPVIVEAAKQHMVSLLVLGQRNIWRIWRLTKNWAWKTGVGRGCSSRMVEYCIQNASCMTFAVRRMSNELGGYLITTKRHKNFWLKKVRK